MPLPLPMIAPPPVSLHLAVDAFMSRHWHRRSLLVRQAIADFDGLFTWPQLRALAARDDVESRLVLREGRRWEMTRGPFASRTWRSLPPRNWTLLVQGTNLHDMRADRLLRRFAFLPYARLDDLMVSYAAPGGGVGPHVDSYDVFLLQGQGRRRWRYGKQSDVALKPRLSLRILARFSPRHEHVLECGDMLYLPPQFAHEGVALDACITCSIGFRAAAATEIAQAFLDYLRDRVELTGRYADPGLAATTTPARIDPGMRERIATMLAQIRVERALVDEFTGSFLSEPGPQVFFSPPQPSLSRAAFARAARKVGVALDRRTQLLYDEQRFFINGMASSPPSGARADLATLADRRSLSAARCAQASAPAMARLHQWYCDGYLDLDH